MADEVEIDGKKYKLVPVTEKEAVLDSFDVTDSSSTVSAPTLNNDVLELPPEVEVKQAEPVVNDGVQMMIKTAKRIGTARVERAVNNTREKREYQAKIGSSVSDKRFFPGSGIEDSSADDFDE